MSWSWSSLCYLRLFCFMFFCFALMHRLFVFHFRSRYLSIFACSIYIVCTVRSASISSFFSSLYFIGKWDTYDANPLKLIGFVLLLPCIRLFKTRKITPRREYSNKNNNNWMDIKTNATYEREAGNSTTHIHNIMSTFKRFESILCVRLFWFSLVNRFFCRKKEETQNVLWRQNLNEKESRSSVFVCKSIKQNTFMHCVYVCPKAKTKKFKHILSYWNWETEIVSAMSKHLLEASTTSYWFKVDKQLTY